MNKYSVGYLFEGSAHITWVYANSEEEALKEAVSNHPYGTNFTILYKKEM